MSDLMSLNAWQPLADHYQQIKGEHMLDMFARDTGRFDNLSMQAAGLFLDYSKNRISNDTLPLLVNLAKERDLQNRISDLMSGETVNNTEQRAALHTALRNRSDRPVMTAGQDVMPDIRRVLSQMSTFSEAVRSGQWQGYSGEAITDIVNIGIGGSDLGPQMVTEALHRYCKPNLSLHFVSNVDGSHITKALQNLNPATTLFIIASKTFTTQETLANAHTARDWFLESAKDKQHVASHFVALSTNRDAVTAFGIDESNMFAFWDWVGGRYSLWSAIGLSVACAVGFERFEELLQGAHDMDLHFQSAKLTENMPVIMALLTVWYVNFFGAVSHLIAPYDQYLHRFPAYLQQLTMESNGKSAMRDGGAVAHNTGPIVWGEPGTNGQHAYFQLVHQGTHLIPADFIVPVESLNPVGRHHPMLLANCIAQTEALMRGKDRETLAMEMKDQGASDSEIKRLSGHKTFSGNRPTNTLLLETIDPRSLGALIALYEHKVFVESVIWDINPFDQWGVELGKQLAKQVLQEIEAGKSATAHDASTNGLINCIVKRRNTLA